MSPGIAVDVRKAPPLLEGSPRNSSLDFQKPPELVGFPGGDAGLIPGSGRSAGEKNGYPFQYSCVEYSMERGAWQAPWGRKESDMIQYLTHTHNLIFMYFWRIYK